MAVAKSKYTAMRSTQASRPSRFSGGRRRDPEEYPVVLANHSADSLHPLAMWKPDPATFSRVEHHPDQPTARRAAEEECLERPGSTYVLETEAYVVQWPDWTMTLHVVDRMHPYSADH